MRRSRHRRRGGGRRLALVGLALIAGLVLPGCDSGDGILFQDSGTLARPDLVRLSLSSIDGDLVTLQVVIGGPTTTDDLFGFNFGLAVSDPAIAHFQPGSETVGQALAPSTCEAGVTALVARRPTGVNVALARNGCAGHGVTQERATVVSLTFQIVDQGIVHFALGATLGAANPPAAFNSLPGVIETVTFDFLPASVLKL